MADNKYKNYTDEAIRELKRLEKEQERIEKAKQRYEKSGGDKRKKQYLDYKKDLKETKSLIDEISNEEKVRLKTSSNLNTSFKSIAKLSVQTKKELSIQSSKSSIFLSLNEKIQREKAKISVLDGEAQNIAEQRESIMSSILDDMQSQANAVTRAMKEESGLEQFAQRRAELQTYKNVLSDEELEKLGAAIDKAELLYKKEQQILSLKQSQQGLYDSLPDSIKSATNFAKGLSKTLKTAGTAALGIGLLVAVLVSSVKLFTDLDKAAADFRKETGIGASQMGEINDQIKNSVVNFSELGLTAEDALNTVKAFVDTYGMAAGQFSQSVNDSLNVLNKNFGVAQDKAAKTLQIFQGIGGVSAETAANMALQTTELAKSAGIPLDSIMEDIADTSENVYGLFRGNVRELISQTAAARRLGTNLDSVLKTTRKLLDFEGGISDELEAAAFVGGQFNLTQARALAAAGKQVDAQEEILRQIQRSGDFRQQNIYTQEALAKAAGMEASEISRLLNIQDQLATLGRDQRDLAEKAIKDGIDITGLNEQQLSQELKKYAAQQEQQATMDRISNAFTSITTTVGSAFLPLLEAIAPIMQLIAVPVQIMAEGFKTIVDFVIQYKDILSVVGIALGSIWAIQKGIVLWQRREAVMRLLNMKRAAATAAITSLSNPMKALAGIAAASIVVGIASRYMSTADDAVFEGNSPGYGKRALMEEGSITLFNDRDTIVAGTNLGGNNNNTTNTNQGTDKLIRTMERLEQAYMRGAQVNLDGRKVTSGLSNVVNESTRNQFSLI